MAEDVQQGAGSPLNFGGQQVPPQLGSMIKWGLVILGLILVFVLLSFLRSVYTNLLWFDALDFRSVYVKVLTTRVLLFVIGALVLVVPFGVSIYIAGRLSKGTVTMGLPAEALGFLKKAILWGSVAVVLAVSIVFGTLLAMHWELMLRFANSVPFNTVDPVFDKDLSFYMFKLPAYAYLQGWALGAAIVILVGTLALYYVNFNLRGVPIELTQGLKVHISIIGAIIMFIMGWGHWLDRWELVLSGAGAIFGAAYTDVHARSPALLILTIIAAASGVLMLVSAYLRGLRLFLGALILWIALFVILIVAWPRVMQQFSVTPNEFAKESQYIDRNIQFTREGFALTRIEEVFFPTDTEVTADLIEQNPLTINNIRLWDPRPLSDVYRQIQLIRPYYDFKEADVDRYTLDGEYRQVLLAAREVAPERLEPETQTWVNTKLIYTHGIGLAMSPVTDFTPEGRPEFFAKDIPANGVIPIHGESATGDPEILVANPRIYYGENTLDYVIVNTNTDELDYQTEESGLVRTKYFGDGGVRIGSFLRRVAYSWEFGDINISISGELTDDSRIQYHRAVQERIETVAPFLLLDADPYIVATESHLIWVQDAYTISDRYPYSDPTVESLETNFNYIRNSVKITVDAYDGTLGFYVWDESDPIIKVYSKMFPGLFLSKSDMPEFLQTHVRYPQDFFTHQAEKYNKYHMRESQNFYNNEDLWAFPNEKFGQTDTLRVVEPYYVIMKLPGEEQEEFMQLLPYTPNQRQNLIGWLAARSDGENYGKLMAFNFPKDRQVDGPEQVEARIDNDQDISAWFTLRCSEGSTCIRGNLLVIPVGDAILYAEPVYIQAEGVKFPELKRVILATGDKVVMEDSLALALKSLVGFTAPTVVTSDDDLLSEGGQAAVPASKAETEIDTLSDVINVLKENLSSLEEAFERLKALMIGGE